MTGDEEEPGPRKQGRSTVREETPYALPYALTVAPSANADDSVASSVTREQFENKATSDYSVASSEASNQYEKTITTVSRVLEEHARNNLAARNPSFPPQIVPGAVSVGAINSVADNDQLWGIETHHSVVSQSGGTVSADAVNDEMLETGGVVSAYAVDDEVHEAKLVYLKKKRLHRSLWAAAAGILIVAVVLPTIKLNGNDGGNNPGTSEIRFSTTITDLCSARHLKVHKNQLFVAEVGVGNEDPETSDLCLPSLLSAYPLRFMFWQDGSGQCVSFGWIQCRRSAAQGVGERSFIRRLTHELCVWGIGCGL
jgi:hypothetical protein